MTAPTTVKRRRQRKHARRPNAPVSVEEREMAQAVMAVIFDLARSAYRARARLLSEGFRVEDIEHEEAVRALLGITEQVVPTTPAIEVPKPGLIRRLLS